MWVGAFESKGESGWWMWGGATDFAKGERWGESERWGEKSHLKMLRFYISTCCLHFKSGKQVF